MPIGNFRQKANPVLVGFVFGCILITVGLLYAMQASLAVANNLSSVSGRYAAQK